MTDRNIDAPERAQELVRIVKRVREEHPTLERQLENYRQQRREYEAQRGRSDGQPLEPAASGKSRRIIY